MKNGTSHIFRKWEINGNDRMPGENRVKFRLTTATETIAIYEIGDFSLRILSTPFNEVTMREPDGGTTNFLKVLNFNSTIDLTKVLSFEF